MTTIVSIIICSCNRAESLRQTLEAIGCVLVPDDLPTELLVVDNASTDHTQQVVWDMKLANLSVRYVREPQKGKGYAYNTGMAKARGAIFLFTDDDVRPPRNWIEGMCRPIVVGKADVVAGGVRIAPHLERPWLVNPYRAWLACTDRDGCGHTDALIGANMAFSRHVLQRVPAFDVELGPGALGLGEESLFSRQLSKAGYCILRAREVVVEHHFDEGRLAGDQFLQAARKLGRSHAYLAYHWEHRGILQPTAKLLGAAIRHGCRWVLRRNSPSVGGVSAARLDLTQRSAFLLQYLRECTRPRKYERFGLVKLGRRDV